MRGGARCCKSLIFNVLLYNNSVKIVKGITRNPPSFGFSRFGDSFDIGPNSIVRLFEKTLFYFEDFNFSSTSNQYFLTDGVEVLAHFYRIDDFDGFVNGFFESFLAQGVRIELTQQLLESRSPSLGTLPCISNSITIFDRFKINSYVEAIDTFAKPVEIS